MTAHWIVTLTIERALGQQETNTLFLHLAHEGLSLEAAAEHTRLALRTQAPTAAAAISGLCGTVEGLGSFDISEVRAVRATDRLTGDPGELILPDLVGYARIAAMAGVSRQRARMFPKIEDFPHPVVITDQGPLFSRRAILTWVGRREAARSR